MVWRNAKRLDVERIVAGGDQRRENDARAELDGVLADIPPEWLKRSDILVAIGEAYGELTLYPEAADYLKRALDTGELNSKATIKAAEEWLNFMARDGVKGQKVPAVRNAIIGLKALQGVAPTAERFNLLAGTHKRLATLLKDPESIRDEITLAARCYQQAHEHNADLNRFDHYPVVNWMALEVVLGNRPPDMQRLLQQAATSAQQSFARDRSAKDAIFDGVAAADIEVVRALGTGSFGQDGAARAAAIDRIIRLYKEAFQRMQATRRQAESATGQLEALATLLKDLSGATPSASPLVWQALETIRAAL
jgi:hypothetical protein